MPRGIRPSVITREGLRGIFTPPFLDELMDMAPNWTIGELMGHLNSLYDEDRLEEWSERLQPDVYEDVSVRIQNRCMGRDPAYLIFDIALYTILTCAFGKQEPTENQEPNVPVPKEEHAWRDAEMESLNPSGISLPVPLRTRWGKFTSQGRLKGLIQDALDSLPLEPGMDRWLRIGVERDTAALIYSRFTKHEPPGRKMGIYDYGPGIYFTASLKYLRSWAKKYLKEDGSLRTSLAIIIMDLKTSEIDPDQMITLPHESGDLWVRLTRDSLREFGRHPNVGCVVGPCVANSCQVARGEGSPKVLNIDGSVPLQFAITSLKLAEELFLRAKLSCFVIRPRDT